MTTADTRTVAERPILFNGEMVRAILDGRKSQTRRVVKFRPGHGPGEPGCDYGSTRSNGVIDSRVVGLGPCMYHTGWDWQTEHGWCRCRSATYAPPAMPGDLLWARETWQPHCDEAVIEYRADDWTQCSPVYADTWFRYDAGDRSGWRPSIHMPKWAARIWLRVTDVRVERVQAINGKDIWEEGVFLDARAWMAGSDEARRRIFSGLWDSLNAKRGLGWEANPWVWVIEFEQQ